MKEAIVQITTPAGRMDAFVTRPERAGRFPAVIVYMDVWGLREELFDIARRIATVGYYCIVPNFYYRHGPVRFEYRNEKGEMRSIETLPTDVQERIRDEMRGLTDRMVVEDTGTVLNFLEQELVRPGPIGAIGYCMGGRHALCAAGHYDAFRATVSLHGTRLVTDAPDSAHRFADRFGGEIYCGFAEHDTLAPPATIAKLAEVLGGRQNVRYESVVHAGTVHGYSLPDRDIFDKQAANRDWEAIFPMLRRQVPPGD